MTAQVHEILIYEGQMTSMASAPELPVNHPEIKIDKDFYSDRSNGITFVVYPKPGIAAATVTGSSQHKQYDPILYSTACWRRYIATWEIKNNKLFLIDIIGKYKLESKEPIFAEWFSGEIKIPRGPMIQYIHMNFASIYEKELHLKIEKGVVIETMLIENKIKKKKVHRHG